jgi:hypothetical protein
MDEVMDSTFGFDRRENDIRVKEYPHASGLLPGSLLPGSMVRFQLSFSDVEFRDSFIGVQFDWKGDRRAEQNAVLDCLGYQLVLWLQGQGLAHFFWQGDGAAFADSQCNSHEFSIA